MRVKRIDKDLNAKLHPAHLMANARGAGCTDYSKIIQMTCEIDWHPRRFVLDCVRMLGPSASRLRSSVHYLSQKSGSGGLTSHPDESSPFSVASCKYCISSPFVRVAVSSLLRLSSVVKSAWQGAKCVRGGTR